MYRLLLRHRLEGAGPVIDHCLDHWEALQDVAEHAKDSLVILRLILGSHREDLRRATVNTHQPTMVESDPLSGRILAGSAAPAVTDTVRLHHHLCP